MDLKTFKEFKEFNESKYDTKQLVDFKFDIKSKLSFIFNSNFHDGGKEGTWNITDSDKKIVMGGYLANKGTPRIDHESPSVYYFKDSLLSEVQKIIKKWH